MHYMETWIKKLYIRAMYNKIFSLSRFCLFIICSVSALSCQNHQKSNSGNDQSRSNNSIQGEVFTIIDGVEVFTSMEKHILDSSGMFNSSLRVFSYVNVSCATCLNEIKKWDSLAKSLSQYDTPIILYLQSKDRYELLKYLIEDNRLAPFSYPFVLDKNNDYFLQNSMLSEAKRLYTVLVNKDNEILWAGDPIHSENDQQKLTQIIADQSVVYASIN